MKYKGKMRKRILCFGLCLVMIFGLAGCRQNDSNKKITVTMLYPMKLTNFEKLVEETYPDIDLQIEVTTSASMNGDSERRLRNGRGTDLVVTTLPTGDVKNFMWDLSATESATSYQATVMAPVMNEGKTLCLPLPGQYSGYILNKTLIRKLNKQMPSSGAEVLDLFNAGKKKNIGIGPDGTMFGFDTVDISTIGSYIIGTRVPDFLGMMDGIKWTGDFKEKKASFSGVWDDSLDILLRCVEKGYLNAKTLSLKETNAMPVRKRMLDGTLLLCYGNVRLFKQLCSESDQYEYEMMPFLSDEGNEPWAISSPDGFIGINDAVSKKGREDKLDACQRVLELLSTQKGQEGWIKDTQATTSYLTEYQNQKNTVPDGLKRCVAEGYVYDLQMPSSVISYFGKNIISVLNGEMKMKDALAAVDDYYRNGSKAVDYDQSVVGSVKEDMLYDNYNTRREETAIGNLVADAVAEYAGTDIAVVNGGGIRASLYQGDVLGADLSAVCPYDNTIVVIEAKGSVILEMMRNSISLTGRQEEIPVGRFLQVSGLKYSYQPKSNDTPAELLSVTLSDGSTLNPDKTYKLAINNYMAGSSGYLDNNGDGYTMLNLYSDDIPKAKGVTLVKDTKATYADAIKAYFKSHQEEPISAKLEGRITVAGKGE